MVVQGSEKHIWHKRSVWKWNRIFRIRSSCTCRPISFRLSLQRRCVGMKWTISFISISWSMYWFWMIYKNWPERPVLKILFSIFSTICISPGNSWSWLVIRLRPNWKEWKIVCCPVSVGDYRPRSRRRISIHVKKSCWTKPGKTVSIFQKKWSNISVNMSIIMSGN